MAHLTEAAIQICEENKRTILDIENGLSQGLTDAEKKEFFRLLDKVKKNIEEIESREL